MHSAKAYLKFLWNSTNHHGVHSPFVYDLVTKCFYDKKKHPSYRVLKKHRNLLFKDSTLIKITDLGAGSKLFTSTERKVFDLAKKAGTSKKRAHLLNRLVSYLEIKEALELGTSVGLGTAAMAAGNPVRLLSLEGCPETAEVARKYLEKISLDNTTILRGSFNDSLKLIKTSPDKKFDLVFFDGHHKKAPTLEYFNSLLPLAHNNSVFIFDDIHWSREMEEAWKEIQNHPSVKVSIDTFQWGLVFFRREQVKQHFVIRT